MNRVREHRAHTPERLSGRRPSRGRRESVEWYVGWGVEANRGRSGDGVGTESGRSRDGVGTEWGRSGDGVARRNSLSSRPASPGDEASRRLPRSHPHGTVGHRRRRYDLLVRRRKQLRSPKYVGSDAGELVCRQLATEEGVVSCAAALAVRSQRFILRSRRDDGVEMAERVVSKARP